MDRGAWRATVHDVTNSQKTDLASKQQQIFDGIMVDHMDAVC